MIKLKTGRTSDREKQPMDTEAQLAATQTGTGTDRGFYERKCWGIVWGMSGVSVISGGEILGDRMSGENFLECSGPKLSGKCPGECS